MDERLRFVRDALSDRFTMSEAAGTEQRARSCRAKAYRQT